MADIYGSHFLFAGENSRTYGLVVANMQTQRMTRVRGEADSVLYFDKATQRNRLIDLDYTNYPVSFEVEFFTSDENCTNVGERVLTLDERRAAERWLFRQAGYRSFYPSALDDPTKEVAENVTQVNSEGVESRVVKQLYLRCRFINPERIESAGGVIGWRATLEADSGLWWQEETDTWFFPNNPATDSVSTFTITLDTDMPEYTYPRITAYTGDAGGAWSLVNNTDDSTRLTAFSSFPANSGVVMQGGVNYLSGYLSRFSEKNFPRLLPGDNNFTVTGNIARIRVRFNNRRML